MKATELETSPGIGWIVERHGVTVVRRNEGAFLSIPYPHAALWAIVADGTYTLERGRELMAAITGKGDRQAEHEVTKTITAWVDAELIEWM